MGDNKTGKTLLGQVIDLLAGNPHSVQERVDLNQEGSVEATFVDKSGEKITVTCKLSTESATYGVETYKENRNELSQSQYVDYLSEKGITPPLYLPSTSDLSAELPTSVVERLLVTHSFVARLDEHELELGKLQKSLEQTKAEEASASEQLSLASTSLEQVERKEKLTSRLEEITVEEQQKKEEYEKLKFGQWAEHYLKLAELTKSLSEGDTTSEDLNPALFQHLQEFLAQMQALLGESQTSLLSHKSEIEALATSEKEQITANVAEANKRETELRQALVEEEEKLQQETERLKELEISHYRLQAQVEELRKAKDHLRPKEELHSLISENQRKLFSITGDFKAMFDELEAGEWRLSTLEEGNKLYPPEVLQFKQLLLEKGIPSAILADFIEIKEEAEEWREAIESCLGNNRFMLLVNETDEVKARKISLENQFAYPLTCPGHWRGENPALRLEEATSVLACLEITGEGTFDPKYVSKVVGELTQYYALVEDLGSIRNLGLYPQYTFVTKKGYHYSSKVSQNRQVDQYFIGRKAIQLEFDRIKEIFSQGQGNIQEITRQVEEIENSTYQAYAALDAIEKLEKADDSKQEIEEIAKRVEEQERSVKEIESSKDILMAQLAEVRALAKVAGSFVESPTVQKSLTVITDAINQVRQVMGLTMGENTLNSRLIDLDSLLKQQRGLLQELEEQIKKMWPHLNERSEEVEVLLGKVPKGDGLGRSWSEIIREIEQTQKKIIALGDTTTVEETKARIQAAKGKQEELLGKRKDIEGNINQTQSLLEQEAKALLSHVQERFRWLKETLQEISFGPDMARIVDLGTNPDKPTITLAGHPSDSEKSLLLLAIATVLSFEEPTTFFSDQLFTHLDTETQESLLNQLTDHSLGPDKNIRQVLLMTTVQEPFITNLNLADLFQLRAGPGQKNQLLKLRFEPKHTLGNYVTI